MKQLFSLFGKILLLVAFAVTAAELAAHGLSSDLGAIPSSGDVWNVFKPDQYKAFLASDPNGLFIIMLKVPAWALLGIPGLLLIIFCRDKVPSEEAELEESLFLYDELVKRVKEEEFENFEGLSQDGTEPNHNSDISIADESYQNSKLDQDLAPKRDFLLK